jgi:hypothetical protein
VRGDPYARAVPAEPSPPELARVVGFAERPRQGDWSLRAALCRYAQAHPARVRDVLEQVRRVEAALHPHARRFDKDGPALWAAVDGGAAPSGDEQLVGVLRAAAALDRLGDGLAAWAEDRHGQRPEVEVDATTAEVAAALDALGVPREERERPPRARARG